MDQRISGSKAAQIAGMTRLEFLEELARRRLDVVKIDLDDLPASSPMPEPPVVDASPLIVLSRAARLDRLRGLADRIIVPAAVASEIEVHADDIAHTLRREASWIERVAAIPIPESVSPWDLGMGESAVLSWALSHPGTVRAGEAGEGQQEEGEEHGCRSPRPA